MLNLCNVSGKARAKNMDNGFEYSTLSTTLSSSKIMNPQFTQRLHNFSTQFSTVKNAYLTDTSLIFSTLSTEPITTTTIIYKEG